MPTREKRARRVRQYTLGHVTNSDAAAAAARVGIQSARQQQCSVQPPPVQCICYRAMRICGPACLCLRARARSARLYVCASSFVQLPIPRPIIPAIALPAYIAYSAGFCRTVRGWRVFSHNIFPNTGMMNFYRLMRGLPLFRCVVYSKEIEYLSKLIQYRISHVVAVT